MREQSFEKLIEESKNALNQLSAESLSLKESLEIYKKGLANLTQAQELLEKAKLEYSYLSTEQKDLV